VASTELPRWLKLAQAAEYYLVSPHLIRALVAYEQVDAAGSAERKPSVLNESPTAPSKHQLNRVHPRFCARRHGGGGGI
jgi:hypothetical protein